MSSIVISIGAAAFGLWLGGMQHLTRIIGASSTMHALTAILFVVSATGVLCRLTGRRAAARLAAGFVLICALLVLIEYSTGINLGIDQLFAPRSLADVALAQLRMAVNTAVAFVLAGIGLLLAGASGQSAWRPALVSVVSVVVFALGAVTVLGYAVDLAAAYQWAGFVPMSLLSGLSFMLLGAAYFLLSIHLSDAHEWQHLPWLSISIGIGLVALTALAWSALDAKYGPGEKRLSELVLVLGMGLSMLIAGMTAQLRYARLQALQLRKANAEVEDLYENAPCGYHSLDKDGLIISMNRTELNWLGYSADEVIGRMPIAKIITEESHRTFLKNFPEFKRRGQLSDLEMDFVRKDGTVLSVLLNATAIRNADGEYVTSRSVVVDITERKRATSRAQLLALLVENSNDAIIGETVQGMISSWNIGAEKMFGYSAAEAVGKPVTIIFPEHLKSQKAILLERLERGEHILQFDTQRLTKAGALLEVSVTLSPIRDSHGQMIGVSKVVRDMTARVRQQAALRDSQERFRRTLEYAPIGMATLSLDGRFVQVNQVLCAIVGYAKEELEGLTFQQITAPEDLDLDLDNVRQLIAGTIAAYTMDKRYIRKDGSRIWVQLSGTLLRSEDGVPQYFVAQIQDISATKQQQEHLRSMTQRLSLAVKAGGIGV